MNLPDWYTDILRQFPGIVFGPGLGWYGIRLLREEHAKNAARADADAARVRAGHDRGLAQKDALIGRLDAQVAELKAERDRLTRQLVRRRRRE